LLHLAAAALCIEGARRFPDAGWRSGWLPLLVFPLLYWEVAILNQGFVSGYWDPVVMQWEQAIFGGSPSSELAARLPWPALSEVLHLAYLAFYPVIYVPPAMLFLRGRRADFITSVVALMATAGFCYAVFVYFPVQGPRYFGPPEGVPDGPVRRFVLTVLESGSSRGAAFPSAHMAITTCQAVLTVRLQPRMGWLVTAIAIGLGIGAVYGGFHYGIDMLAGGVVGLGISLTVLRLRMPRGGSTPAEASS